MSAFLNSALGHHEISTFPIPFTAFLAVRQLRKMRFDPALDDNNDWRDVALHARRSICHCSAEYAVVRACWNHEAYSRYYCLLWRIFSHARITFQKPTFLLIAF
jgi:hypothetical protein